MHATKINLSKSEELFKEAIEHIPGGVNSPVRAFKGVGGSPVFIEKAKGQYFWDEDGNKYLDLINSWGALIHGHSHPEIVEVIKKTCENGVSYGAPHKNEIELAKLVKSRMPSIEKIRLVNSGTEAVMTAIRLAKGFTKRDKIIKFSGCYHGHSDQLLSQAGSGVATLGIPSSSGVSKAVANETLTLPYNDTLTLELTLNKFPSEVACIIVEPVIGNAGLIKPNDNFIKALSELRNRFGYVLIFDEVMTGFRVAPGGAQEKYNIKPDLTTLGKIIGGGMPIGAVGGKKEIMDLLAPSGSVYQAGTLSGNPLAVACGIKTLSLLTEKEYKKLNELASALVDGILLINEELSIKTQVVSSGAMFCIFFNDSPVIDFDSAKKSNTEMYSRFFHFMLSQGIYFPPSQFEAGFLSTAMTEKDIKDILSAYSNFFKQI